MLLSSLVGMVQQQQQPNALLMEQIIVFVSV